MSNFLQDIEITNFKSIRHQKIEGCKRINVFIGYPNVGKSNILEAISTLAYLEGRHSNTVHLSELVRLQDLFYLLFFDGDTEAPACINYYANKRIALSYQQGGGIIFERQHLIDVYGVGVHEWITLGDIIAFQPKKLFGKTEASMTSSAEKLVVKRYHFRGGNNFNVEGRHSLLYPFGENLFGIIESRPSLRKELVEILQEYGLKLSFDKRGEYSLTVLKTLNDETIFLTPFALIADTLQRLIFYKAAIASNKDTVLLFEEPEAHMFPPYISKFTADVMYNENGNQYFINTHSPFVINDFMENMKSDELSIYVVGYKKTTGETVVRKLTEEELNEIYQYGIDLYYNLERYLEHEEQ